MKKLMFSGYTAALALIALIAAGSFQHIVMMDDFIYGEPHVVQ